MHSYIRPNTHVALRLPSGIVKILEITPNQTINLGKFGTFNSNLILGRPYYLTFELLDKDHGKSKTELRVVPASELHAEALGNEHAPATEASDEAADSGAGFDIVSEDGQVLMRNNRLTVDDASRQALSMAEIEELKKAGAGSGKDIIAKIMASHNAIDEKTTFSLAKYTLRKSRKYLKRFTALPLDVGLLTEYILEKEAYKIMELREDLLGLICSWANIHCGAASQISTAEDGVSQIGGGRWLVVDDTGGLVTAALAERMGILYPEDENDALEEEEEADRSVQQDEPPQAPEQNGSDTVMADADKANTTESTSTTAAPSDPPPRPRKPPRPHIPQMSAPTNSLTVLHPNNQPNLSHLKYFGYDYGNPTPSHPLYKHLKTLSWLSMLHPEDDPQYDEPEVISEEVLATMKSSKRGTYYKKRRRWERVKSVVDETRRGGFDGLVVATAMDAKTVLKELIPLVKGGGKVVVYNPNVEPLVELCDLYSKERRAAYIAREFGPPPTQRQPEANGSSRSKKPHRIDEDDDAETSNESTASILGNEDAEDFPLNPTLLLAPMLQTARARQWQVLPGRTHPMMTSKGGAEGYLFTGTRVLPIEGRVEARGQHGGKKKRKVDEGGKGVVVAA
ncbi:tRNA (adenine(58)-N(1))-methyltransferase non-catalytic subunit trm6 [Neocucurbitaria cava]|uniref:tRNA (adenine(58)-N(1))-methyltransferase non-catalytic subunit TRM6 n=1 Tax=Neocucurbitaria cava TaxID=798079 RepID=A0A9W9CJF8_9PLEO|nr:tRNA (adenine(58)-N(1))-methyltransferase non-catalytic subunit trm6 [Neocucurbitaria cava]